MSERTDVLAVSTKIAVVMAGGSGERFWPLSRPDRPKQLLKLTDPNRTMLQEAVERISPLVGDQIFVSTSRALQDPILAANLVPEAHVLCEPASRNTMGALVWVAANLLATGKEDVTVAVLTADHKIGHPEAFLKTVHAAMDVAEQTGGLVTIGIVPSRPETGYGYIEVDHQLKITTPEGRIAYATRKFLEKPSLQTAIEFVESGNYFWNAGMFFYTLKGFLSALEKTNPEIYALTLNIAQSLRENNQREAEKHYEHLPNISVDFALMEKASEVYVVPSDFPWDDVGSWDALERSMISDSAGNVVQGRVIAVDSNSSVLYNDDPDRLIGVVGLTGLVVVATHDSVLVCPKADAQRVKQIVAELKKV